MTFLKSPAFARIAPFAVYILLLALDSSLSGLMAGMGVDARWLYALRVGAVALLLAYFWRQYSELSWPVNLPLRMWGTSLLAGIVVFALWILPYPTWATLGGAGAVYDPSNKVGDIDWSLALIRITGAALVVPLMEELFFRSYIMRWLDKSDFLAVDPARITLYAFVATSVLFAIEHDLWLAGLMAGILYGGLYKLYRNLWAPVLAHAVTNGMLGVWVLQTKAWQYW